MVRRCVQSAEDPSAVVVVVINNNVIVTGFAVHR
jgi:hypothetical protein